GQWQVWASVRRRVTPCDTFFFSSRRRHTRSKRDWSSDVCSSDLVIERDRLLPARDELLVHHVEQLEERHVGTRVRHVVAHELPRSEERRVGKECRSRWSRYP